MKKHIFTGSATAMITPFRGSKKDVDYPSFDNLIRYQLNMGADALVIAGTTGESPVLSDEERRKLFRIAVNLAGKKIPVIAGCGTNDTELTVRKSNDAEKQGVDSLLIVTPFYNKCTQDGIIKHYNYIADRVSAPVIVYNVPSRTGVDIKPETYEALSEHKNICGIKEANGNISAMIKTKALCKESIDIYCGNDEQTTAFMANGAKGVISVAGNIIPDIMKEITLNCIKNNIIKASEILSVYHKLFEILFREVNPIPVKYMCSRIFGIENSLRMPLCKLNPALTEEADLCLKNYKLI